MHLQYACTKCDTIELIDVVFPDGLPAQVSEQLCCQCKTGSHHHIYSRERYNPAVDTVANRSNGIGLS